MSTDSLGECRFRALPVLFLAARFKEIMAAPPIDRRTYKALLDQVNDGVYIVDLDRRILYWNEGAFRQTGNLSLWGKETWRALFGQHQLITAMFIITRLCRLTR